MMVPLPYHPCVVLLLHHPSITFVQWLKGVWCVLMLGDMHESPEQN